MYDVCVLKCKMHGSKDNNIINCRRLSESERDTDTEVKIVFIFLSHLFIGIFVLIFIRPHLVSGLKDVPNTYTINQFQLGMTMKKMR